MNKDQFDDLVNDFEYGVIDSYEQDEFRIEWCQEDETCYLYQNGEIVRSGGFERLLEVFLDLEAAENV